jgi:hypothetical protein
MTEELRFGEVNPDGSIKRDVRVSALSGRRIEKGDPMIRITGTPYFYRLEAQELRLLQDETDPEATAVRQKELDDMIALNLPACSPCVVRTNHAGAIKRHGNCRR